MRAVTPYVEIMNDSPSRIMARSGTCMGMDKSLAVWRFGFLPKSPASKHYGVCLSDYGFLWVLATRKTGKVKRQIRCMALELPAPYCKVLDWEPR